ncbi:hypothetical protein pb186bvf_004026 [Paramecium bursaria]
MQRFKTLSMYIPKQVGRSERSKTLSDDEKLPQLIIAKAKPILVPQSKTLMLPKLILRQPQKYM